MVSIERWTGQEAGLLQEVLRLSIRQFAQQLGVNPATVQNWRKGGAGLMVSYELQQVLDAQLQLLPDSVRQTFLERCSGASMTAAPPQASSGGSGFAVNSHQFVPVHLSPEDTELYEAGTAHHLGPGNLSQRTLDVPGGDEFHQCKLHVYEFGVAVLHIQQRMAFSSITDLAVWRYPSYERNRAWARQAVSELVSNVVGRSTAVTPQYTLSVYELVRHGWGAEEFGTALHLLATPGVLVDRSIETAPVSLEVEPLRFAERWAHPNAIAFTGTTSRGVAGWSGVAYWQGAGETALSIDDIVAMELDTQALWALSSALLHRVEEGHDPQMPEQFGWRWLRGAASRLTSARPTESAEHRAMRAAVLGTSDLPERLRDAWSALKEAS
ncbi:XRE family transcriptional regulator [Kitasatospora phosalacinea]|uniref:XRE family transcriptional regulator n=1 Tax=Kitasatospora phosalacinea TaxID=2065 RepID=UPI00255344A8|nr:XRE family transcriptional regulator [Kitasatospora phosalacinea]